MASNIPWERTEQGKFAEMGVEHAVQLYIIPVLV